MSIPLNNIVKINPGVLDVGNNGNNLFGLMLTKKTDLSISSNTSESFSNAEAVGKEFGYDSTEYKLATIYFSGFTNSDRVAAKLYIAPYYTENSPIRLVGGDLTQIQPASLAGLKGDLTIKMDDETYSLSSDFTIGQFSDYSTIVDNINKKITQQSTANSGTAKTPASKALKTASSDDSASGSSSTESNTDVKPVLTYSAKYNAIVIQAPNNAVKTITVSGEIANALFLTTEKGARLYRVEKNASIPELLNNLRQTNLSFCSVFLSWTAERAEQEDLAIWATSMKDDVCVILNDKNQKAFQKINLTDSTKDEDLPFARLVSKKNYESVACVYDNLELCAFIAGYPAAWDLTKTDGRFTAAFRRNSLLEANVLDAATAENLRENGYNFYGAWASATSNFTFMYEGRISGQYAWLDSWFCQVWIRRQFQYYFIMTLLAKGQIPYNTDGKGILQTAIKPAIDQYLNFGAIRPGIALADEQVQQLKQAGLNQSQINNITTVGYYLSVDMARVSPTTRLQRGSPPISFWYTDGQSVQQINMNSIEIQ